MKNEKEIMKLILHGGNARTKALESIAKASDGDAEYARELLAECNVELNTAHQTQTDFIQAEMRGESTGELSLLMIHAQDHLMNAMTIRDIAKVLIDFMNKVEVRTHV